MKQQTNFDIYLEEQLKDLDFAERFGKAGETWDRAMKPDILRYREKDLVNPVNKIES
jgi:hypothetical protein